MARVRICTKGLKSGCGSSQNLSCSIDELIFDFYALKLKTKVRGPVAGRRSTVGQFSIAVAGGFEGPAGSLTSLLVSCQANTTSEA